jgi:uncharacterized protein (TIGR03118 family)
LKNSFAVRVSSCCFAVLILLATIPASAQTIGYRANRLAADAPGAAHTSPALLNPWGIAFLPGGNFFIAENASGRVDSYDAFGNIAAGVTIPAPLGSAAAFSRPTGITAVSEPNIGPVGTQFQFLVAADNGTVWGFSTADGASQVATKFVDNSSTPASYTGIAFVHPDCCGPYIAVANFAEGNVDTFTRFGDRLSLSPLTANPFIDPDLPPGFAPFNIQVIGNQIFVVYAAQGAHQQVVFGGGGGGLVDIFDTVGNFVKRFISPGIPLNAPWGITQASANFGPFSNDILIANAGGDRSISAFDPSTGAFAGQLTDASGTTLIFGGVRGLAFRADNVGDANALYFVDDASPTDPPTGAFGAITTGNAAFIGLTFFDTTLRAAALPGDPVTMTAGIVVPLGVPTGTVAFVDTCCALNPTITQTTLGTVSVVDGSASLTTAFPSGDHVITARYSGDANLVPGSTSALLAVLLETHTTLTAPPSLASGLPAELSVNVGSNPPVQLTSITGQVTFFDGNVILGTVALNTGAAQLTINSLSLGAHSIVAQYSGSRFFQGSTSAPAAIAVVNPIPAITSLAPFSEQQNSGAFTLTLHGSGFVNGAVVTFNGAARPTQFESATLLKASIAASDLTASGTATIAVSNPAPGGGNSGIAIFAIDTATATSVTLDSPALTVAAGQSVTVGAHPTGFTGAVSVMCLNAPVGMTCAFNQANNSVTIQTTAATPKGSQAITVVFSAQALARDMSSPSFLAMSLGVLGLPLGSVVIEGRRRRKLKRAYWMIPVLALLLLMSAGCGGYGSPAATPSNPTPPPQSGQASASLIVTVQ